MRSSKSGRKPSSGSSPPQKKTRDPSTPTGVPTWPRLDLVPPQQRLAGLRDWGRVVLTSGYLSKTDRAVVDHAVRQLTSGEPEMFVLLRKMSDAASARKLFELITTIAGAAYVIGAHGAMTDTQDTFFKKSRAVLMRLRRPKSRRNRDLEELIEAKIVEAGPSVHPSKDAEAWVADIRNKMKARGHKKGVSQSTIYRRLKKHVTLQE
jgi:hypothetical protein